MRKSWLIQGVRGNEKVLKKSYFEFQKFKALIKSLILPDFRPKV